jgi:hypothetical protein
MSMMYESSLNNPQTIERGGFTHNAKNNDKVIGFRNRHGYKLELDFLIENLLDFRDFLISSGIARIYHQLRYQLTSINQKNQKIIKSLRF